MKYRWTIAAPQPLLVTPLAEQLGVTPLLAQCLLNRGLASPSAMSSFLHPRLKDLDDPFLLPNMQPAVARLLLARQAGEPLVIFGDYDVDGVSATALLLTTLRALGWKAEPYLPLRLEEGYGLSQEAAENCLAKLPARLLLAVDCGSTAVETISWLATRGIGTIVLDHHQVSTPPPPAIALVNPRLGPPSTELCAAGLAFKLAHALVKRMREQNLPGATQYDIRETLDLVALATIADMVPLTGENRSLVTAGLQRLNAAPRPGLAALQAAAKSPPSIGVYEVAFQLAPRLNAAGRLENAQDALLLLLAPDLAQAQPLARELDFRNRRRQDIERDIAHQVIAAVRSRFDPARDFVIIEGRNDWHIGVIGIVASRVLQEFHRPTIILGGDGENWRGSGRSIEGFDLAAALRDCAGLLLRHGGHAMAAGLSTNPKNLEPLRRRLNNLARRCLQPEQLQPSLKLDAAVTPSDLTLPQIEELTRLQPTGQANPPPLFAICGLSLARPPQRMGKENQHVKLWINSGGNILEAVWWNCPATPLPQDPFDLAFTPAINDYNGKRFVQLKIADWRPSAPQ